MQVFFAKKFVIANSFNNCFVRLNKDLNKVGINGKIIQESNWEVVEVADIEKSELRKKLKADFVANGFDGLSYWQALENALCASLPRCDAKAITDTLSEKYVSVENTKKIPALQMIKVDGIHPTAAIYISLLQRVPQRIMLGKNRKIRFLTTTDRTLEYAKNMLSLQEIERVAMICLDERKRVVNAQYIAKGEESHASVSPSLITQIMTIYKPKYVIMAHNHICESLEPSHSDVSFTINTRKLIGRLGGELTDHIIVNKDDAISMASNTDFSFIFNQ